MKHYASDYKGPRITLSFALFIVNNKWYFFLKTFHQIVGMAYKMAIHKFSDFLTTHSPMSKEDKRPFTHVTIF